MNLIKLKQAEEVFLQRYPGGFGNQEIMTIRKKRHNVDKMIVLTQDKFSERSFRFPDQVLQTMVKVISSSSVIALFEKPRFKDFIYDLSSKDRVLLSDGLKELLHGEEQTGFEIILDILKSRKLAKWSLLTICQAYFHPQRDVFVKPTTAKDIIGYFELKNLKYKPTPSWSFYDEYRAMIQEMKLEVDASLSPTNLAFSWFLLLSSHGNLF
jgi:hypothetical protein